MDKDESHIAIWRAMPLSPDASDIFEPWWRSLQNEELAGKFSSWHGKLGGAALRLSLTLTYLNWASNYYEAEPYEVTPETVQNALQ